MENLRVPQFYRFLNPIIEVLKELGGSGKAGEVIDLVVEKLNISEDELSETIKSGASRIKNQIQWARLALVKAGFLGSSPRGVWSLNEKGLNTELSLQRICHRHRPSGWPTGANIPDHSQATLSASS